MRRQRLGARTWLPVDKTWAWPVQLAGQNAWFWWRSDGARWRVSGEEEGGRGGLKKMDLASHVGIPYAFSVYIHIVGGHVRGRYIGRARERAPLGKNPTSLLTRALTNGSFLVPSILA